MDTRAGLQVNFDADEVRTLIADYLGIGAKQVTDEAHLGDDLGLDWLNQLELMILIEPVKAEIITQMRFVCNLFGTNPEIIGNKRAYFISIKIHL